MTGQDEHVQWIEESILVEAERVVNGPRQKDYGEPLDNFTTLAKLIEPIVGVPLTAEQAALIMVQVKVARLLQTPDHRDSAVDLAGYALVERKIVVERKRRAAAALRPLPPSPPTRP